MYTKPIVAFLLIPLFLSMSLLVNGQSSTSVITITPDMVSQLTGGNPTADALFDGDIGTPWFPGWNAADYPARCRIDLGESKFIDTIKLYDGVSRPDFYIFYANEIDEEPKFLHRMVLDDFQAWRSIPVFQEMRYIYLTLVHPFGEAQITEMLISEGDTTPVDTFIPRGEADKINLCGFHWVPLDRLEPFRMIRIYISGGWLWRPDGLFVEPLYQAQTADVYGYDSYFEAAKAENILVMPTIHQTPDWYAGVPEGFGSNDHPPIKTGLNRTDPASYQDYADFWWQFTARYGSRIHPISRLRVDTTPRWTNDPPNIPRSGLNLIEYVEVWNEPDKWWRLNGPHPEIYMQPEEYAAMLSISYDSIKSADPGMTVVMSGLTGFDTPYLQRMKQWFEANRADQKFAADVINVHHYSHVGNVYGVWPPTWYDNGAVCPEMDAGFPRIAEIVQFADSIGLKVWSTEFGSDSRDPSWMYSPPRGGFTSEELQAQWLVRDYLEYLRYGVDNMFMFNAIDEPNGCFGGLYQSSGLMYGENANLCGNVTFDPKPSYVAVAELIEQLTFTTYEADKSLSSPNVRIMSFRKADGGERIIYWSPTMDGTEVDFSIPGTSTLTATEWPQYLDIN